MSPPTDSFVPWLPKLKLNLQWELSNSELRAACKDACILEFILSLYDGCNTQIGLERAVALSGGSEKTADLLAPLLVSL